MFRGTGFSSFPWWPTEEPIVTTIGSDTSPEWLLARTALADGRHGPIIDIGAFGNLAGDEWAREQADRATKAGHKSQQRKLTQTMSVSGVGQGAQAVEWEVTLPITMTTRRRDEEETELSKFTTPIIPNSKVPGLLGLRTIQKMRGLIDTFSEPPLMMFCGPGNYRLELPAGSKTIPLARAPSGHLIMPTSDFDRLDKNPERRPREQALRPGEDDITHLPAMTTSSSSSSSTDPRLKELQDQVAQLQEQLRTVSLD